MIIKQGPTGDGKFIRPMTANPNKKMQNYRRNSQTTGLSEGKVTRPETEAVISSTENMKRPKSSIFTGSKNGRPYTSTSVSGYNNLLRSQALDPILIKLW